MSIAAVPNYLGSDFSQASPGMRFGLLLPIWTNRTDQQAEVTGRAQAASPEGREVNELLMKKGMDATIVELCQRKQKPLPSLWDKNDSAAHAAWKKITTLAQSDQQRMRALAKRQEALANTVANLLRLDALATAPFTTGLGNEHPLENGFAFLNPYGLPYLAGSGIKGVLRQSARELASGDWGDASGWNDNKTIPLMQGASDKRRAVLDTNQHPVMLAMIDVLFGRESEDGDSDHLRGALGFWDVIPQIKGDSLTVEVMTPHQGHYYQQKLDKMSGDSITPHDSGQPNPIHFLTVPPGSGFTFHVVCDTQHLARLAPELAANDRWQSLLTAAFTHAFAWLGFGAKTAVGYGALEEDPEVKQVREKAAQAVADKLRAEQAAREREADLAALAPTARAIREFLDARPDKNQTELSALFNGLKSGRWSGDTKREIALHVEQLMRNANKWKENTAKKNPDKDHDYQDTLKVKAWLRGQ